MSYEKMVQLMGDRPLTILFQRFTRLFTCTASIDVEEQGWWTEGVTPEKPVDQVFDSTQRGARHSPGMA